MKKKRGNLKMFNSFQSYFLHASFRDHNQGEVTLPSFQAFFFFSQ